MWISITPTTATTTMMDGTATARPTQIWLHFANAKLSRNLGKSMPLMGDVTYFLNFSPVVIDSAIADWETFIAESTRETSYSGVIGSAHSSRTSAPCTWCSGTRPGHHVAPASEGLRRWRHRPGFRLGSRFGPQCWRCNHGTDSGWVGAAGSMGPRPGRSRVLKEKN